MIREKAVVPEVRSGCATQEEWRERRKNVLETLAEMEYGKRPQIDYRVSWKELVRERVEELGAIHIRSKLSVQTVYGSYSFPVTVFLPDEKNKVPGAVLICSQSREAGPMQMPPGIDTMPSPEEFQAFFQQFGIIMENPSKLGEMFQNDIGADGKPKKKTLDLDLDYENGHWPVREMMKRKFAMIGFYANDAEADDAERFPSGLATIFGTERTRKEQEWGVLAVWAFAARCVMDYVEQIPEIDAANVAVTGHSRCGKAALWCGANDERFRAVMPNGSGCCGAALSLGKTGENLASIQTFFPHWFVSGFRRYAGKENELPFDQHFLLAAVAPRILHVGSGSEDAWADPEGEYYSTCLASQAWKYYEPNEVSVEMSEVFPEENGIETAGNVGYHLRKGGHKLDTFDWICLWQHMQIR